MSISRATAQSLWQEDEYIRIATLTTEPISTRSRYTQARSTRINNVLDRSLGIHFITGQTTHDPKQCVNSMQHNPAWYANRSSVSREIPQIVWNLKAHYCIHKNLPLVPMLSYMNLVHTIRSYFCNIGFNIILQFTPKSYKWSPSFRFPHRNHVNFAAPSCVPHNAPTSHSLIWSARSCVVMNTHRHSVLCNFLQAPATSSLL